MNRGGGGGVDDVWNDTAGAWPSSSAAADAVPRSRSPFDGDFVPAAFPGATPGVERARPRPRPRSPAPAAADNPFIAALQAATAAARSAVAAGSELHWSPYQLLHTGSLGAVQLLYTVRQKKEPIFFCVHLF